MGVGRAVFLLETRHAFNTGRKTERQASFMTKDNSFMLINMFVQSCFSSQQVHSYQQHQLFKLIILKVGISITLGYVIFGFGAFKGHRKTVTNTDGNETHRPFS